MRLRTSVKLAVLVVIGVMALPAIAGEGRFPIWQYPTIITAPGKYIVTRDISSLGGAMPIIDIQVANVDVDINGFVLDASGSPAPAINIADDIVDVVLHNGMLVGGTESILRGTTAGTIGQRVVIEDIQSRDATNVGIRLWSIREVVIRRVNIIDPATHGIWLDRTGGGGFTNGTIEHCAIRLPGNDGIHVDNGSALSIRHNRIEVPSLHGIHVLNSYACLIGENTISDADGNGIFVEGSHGIKVYNNVVSRGETNGILVDAQSGDNFLLDNLVRQSGWGGFPGPGSGGGSGIVIDGFRNHLEANTVNESDACGLLFNGPNNTFGRNMARANDPSGSFCTAALCTFGFFPPDSCDTNGTNNTSYGDNLIPGPPVF